jgi:Tol biopolymer transport system component
MNSDDDFPTITRLSPEGAWPSFSNDGSELVFAAAAGGSNRRLMLLSLNSDAGPIAITPPDIDASRPTWRWSPSLIAFTYNNDALYTIERDGSNCRPFLTQPPSGLPALLHPSWYSDMKSIAAVGMTETGSGRQSVLYKVTPGKDSGRQLEALTKFPNVCAGRPTVSPDGKAVAFAGNAGRCNQEGNQLWVVSPPGEAFRLEPGEAISAYQGRSPNWSPDGKWIAFVSTRPAANPAKATLKAVWVVRAKGGKAYQLTGWDCNAANVEWSPDQRKIALGSTTYGIGIFDVPDRFLPSAED